jgi:hypothetical protein
MGFKEHIPFFQDPNHYGWIRILPRSRSNDLQESLAMRVADPLWMLGRQWQFGEFQGEDNGSPATVQVNFHNIPTQLHEGNREQPLEMQVEYIPPPKQLDWRTRIRVGQQFARFLKKSKEKWIGNMPPGIGFIIAPEEEALDENTRDFVEVAAGNTLDGQALVWAMRTSEWKNWTLPWLEAMDSLRDWWHRLYEPENAPSNDYWLPEKLCHQFKLEVQSTNLKIHAPDYQSGELDWYSFDEVIGDQGRWPIRYAKTVSGMLPTNLTFAGMPHKRLYQFEDRRIDFGRLQVETRELAKLLLMEFALTYGNDWFNIGLELPVGSFTRIDHLVVTDVFGVQTTIAPAMETAADATDTWDVFRIGKVHPGDNALQSPGLFLPPVLAYREESPPLEEVLFARDEFANLVWGIESIIANGLGQPVKSTSPPAPVEFSEETESPVYPVYRLMTELAPHWVPYKPTQLAGSNQIALQQATVALTENENIPQTSLQLAIKDKKLREEVIPRSGRRLQLTRQRCRGYNGRTYIWTGRKVVLGKGEENSGLLFDLVKR